MRSVDETKIKKFVNDINDGYQAHSIVSEYHDVLPFNSARHESKSFFQIGRRHNLPKDTFPQRDNISTLALSRQFARAITMGEKEFIARRFAEAAGGMVDSATSEDGLEIEAIKEGFVATAEPDYILMPLVDEYQDALRDWFLDDEPWMAGLREIAFLGSKAEVVWLPSDSGVDEIVLVNGNATQIVRKEGSEARDPDQFRGIQQYRKYSEGKAVVCSFAEYPPDEGRPDEFDFFYRVVLSEPEFRKGSGFVIQT